VGKRNDATTWPLRDGVGAQVFGPGFDRWTAVADTLQQWILAEPGAGRLLPWVPVAFGAGIAIYFTAEHEPLLAAVVPAALMVCLAAFLARRHRLFPVLVLVAAMFCGFAAATLKTARIAHAVLMKPLYSVTLRGFVETHEERERTDRFVLRVTQMDAPRATTQLERVRLSVKKGTAPTVGSFVALKARLMPPLQALRPGSYDFARDMYFQGIGASGFAMGAITQLDAPDSGGWSLRYAAVMQNIRDAIDARIRTVLDGDVRSIATALLTGRRDAISTSVNDAMFISGLGHVLSISGYHMAVVAGVVFFAVRALLALVPILTVTFPIKKAAAAAALFAATFYLLLSGAEVATQRSFFMTALVLIAVIVDRRAITFRTLAVAAMAVLMFIPESLVHPSFQMSFAATLGLVAMVQIALPGLFAAPDNSVVARAALWGGREVVALAAASFIAGLATTPYSAFHFHRITPYGVLANLAAMPVVSAVVMPAGLLGIAAIPFGFDGVFWRIMGVGIDWMIAVTEWVAALPGAIGRMASFGTGPLLLVTAGIVWLGLLRTPLRWGGAALIVVASLWAVMVTQPDVLISADARTVAVRGPDGKLRVMRTSKDSFQLREWLAADADPRAVTDASLSDGVSCDDTGCVAPGKGNTLVSMALKPEAFAEDCARATMIVALHQPPRDCAALVLDQVTLQRRGAVMLTKAANGGFNIAAIRPRGTDRPWSPAIAESDDDFALRGTSTSTTPTGAKSRAGPVDSTPAESDIQPDDQ
jgi:competence protein ComEC